MKIITLNLNGIRSAARKGLFDWLDKQDADIVCLQEIKAQEEQLSDAIFHPESYYCRYLAAEKKGYSGVALYSKMEPQHWLTSFGWKLADQEGRYLQADFPNLTVISLYMPSGSSGDERQAIKFEFLQRFSKQLKKLRQKKRSCIICGDWNIAHKKIDIKNWRGNQKNSGFLPEERAWMDELFGVMDFVDAFRVVDEREEQYTWWSNRGQAWAKNVGWRIDYQVVTPDLADKVKSVEIYKEQRFSDHAPLIIEYDL